VWTLNSFTGHVSYATVAAASPPSPRELDEFREQADRFIAEQDEEFYLHYAGLKETLDLEQIYARHANLTTLETAQRVGLAVNGGKGVRELWRFACEGYMGNLSKAYDEKVAELEATLETEVDGERYAYRMLRPAIANTDDRVKRARLDQARTDLTDEHLNPVYLEGVHVVHSAAEDLGASSYKDLYIDRFGWKLEELAEQCRAFLDATEDLYVNAADRLFRERVGVSLAEAERYDTMRLFRGVKWDSSFPKDRMLPALVSTLADLGVDLRTQENVHLDVEPREKKDPRAFCSPIEVPGKVMLVIKPMGGPDDWRALFHEAGHTEHFAHTSADLKMEERRLGDNAVTEGWAMLMQHLTDEPTWLQRMLDFPRPAEYAAEGATTLLFFVRRYSAKLLYELEFHSAEDLTAMRPRYVELLGDALKIEPSPTDYLADIDGGYYVSSYLRSWAFEAQLREYLRRRYGNDWFTQRKAGDELRELWSEGQKHTAEELLQAVTGEQLDMESVAVRVREALS
jgi:oligoendopeptidase F